VAEFAEKGYGSEMAVLPMMMVMMMLSVIMLRDCPASCF
jgi:hypothetical protein